MLQTRDVLRFLADAPRIVADASEAGEGIRALVRQAVPTLADEAVLYILGSDGRLYARFGAARGRGARGRSDLDTLETQPDPLPLDAEHPAALACRARGAAYQEEGDPTPSLKERGAQPAGGRGRIRSVGLPLLRDGEAAGALHLALVGPGRHYGAEDLESLEHLGAMLSLTLESARLRREAREARRAKTDFLSVMSHELRTPLTAIVGYADLMEAGISGPVNETQETHLGRIKDSAWELLELIDGILGFARYEGQSPDLKIEEVRPSDLVEDTLALFRSSLAEKGLELRTDWEAGLPTFRTDREKTVKILFHVLSNALKFTAKGAVCVKIEVDEQWATFIVSDTGAGIGPADLKMIFEPFWQAQRPETRTTGGTGMGLSLARRLTELLSGDIDVDSELGVGTTVRLRLPRNGPIPVFP